MRNCIKRLLTTTSQSFCQKIPKKSAVPIQSPDRHQQRLQNYFSELQKFTKNFDKYLQIAKNSPLSFVVLFTRSCLIANEHISPELYYPTFKKAVRNDAYELTPFLCTALIQCLAQFKFEGDQNKIIERLCRYYQDYYQRFSWIQEIVFWENYMKIMGQKAHSSIKFIEIERKKKQTLEFSTIKTLAQSSKSYSSFPKHIISQLSFPRADEMSLKITPPSKFPKASPILLQIKQYTDPNNSFQREEDTQSNELNKQLINNVMSEIKYFKNSVNKDWNIVVVGRLEKWEQEKQEQFRHTDLGLDGSKLDYLRTQKVQNVFDKVDLGNYQCLEKLMLSSHYIQGIFYTSTKPNSKKIDMITTLLLSTLSCQNAKIIPIVHQLSSSTFAPSLLQTMLQFCPLPLISQTYGYLSLCSQLQSLYKCHIEVQSHLSFRHRKQKTQKYNLDILQELVESQSMTIEEAKRSIVQETAMLASMAVQNTRDIGLVQYEGAINGEPGQAMARAAADIGWQFGGLFGNVATIMGKVVKKWEQKPQEMLKVKIIAQRKYIPSIIDSILQCKYLTVPKIQPSKNDKKRQEIMAQILRMMNKK